jgi:hypothetical protein
MKSSHKAAESVLSALEAPTTSVRLEALFDRALAVRDSGERSGRGNLYGTSAGPEAMLAAFRLLVQDTPMIRFGHLGANTVIDNATQDDSPIHIVDIGIGHGLQWDELLTRLAARAIRPRLRITGIDLASPGNSPTEALDRTGARLAAHAAQLGLVFAFEAIAGSIEHVARPASLPGERMIVNAALALHHVADGDAVTDPALGRCALLRRLADWKPALLTLIEPDAGHNEVSFVKRVREARRHYGLVFDVFAHLFPHDPVERTTLERCFFGNEILNVVASEGADRVERHDRIATWCRKMTEAGFEALPLGALATSHARVLDLEAPFSIERRGPAMALCFGGKSLLAVTAWMPA